MKTSKVLGYFALFLCVLTFVPTLRAQGDDNPAGASGQFNGNVSTAGSYDPYTGNATRSITDIAVPGSVGMYPLALTRTINTRTNLGPATTISLYPFGKAGGWRHNYQWEVATWSSPPSYDPCAEFSPSSYVVTYPDGRQVTFVYDSAHPQSFKSTTVGIADRFLPVSDLQAANATTDTGTCHLLMSNGGRVIFNVSVTIPRERVA